jgi:copper resistance protein C
MDFKNQRIDKYDLKLAGSDKLLSIFLDKSKLKSGANIMQWLVLSKDDSFITSG